MKTSSRSSKRKSKHSQKRSKKKTRSSSEKTKKLKQRDQLESFTDEDSLSNSLVSCSSPTNETRTKMRSRSRDRKRRKDKKKRSKKSRLARESSGDSGDESPHVKKRKRSKKKGGSDTKKKRSVKRRKRDQSVSSSSRSRLPCEPSFGCEREYEGKEDKVELKERKGREKCRERSASKKSRDKSRSIRSVCEPNDDSERDFEGKEENLESKEWKGREKKSKGRSASKRGRDRSRSCSPTKLHSENNNYCSEDRELEMNYPKRLKSVIVVVKEYETVEEQELNRDDGHKDEIVCDFDDYPSKSNDSNDGVSGRVVPYSHEISSVERSLDDPNSKFVASDVKTSEVLGFQSQVAEGSGGMTSSLVRSRVDDPLMESRSEVSIDNASSMGDDLEAILRQKALENLLKRQGKLSTKIADDKNTNYDIELKKPSIGKAEPGNYHKPNDEENIKPVQKVGPTISSGPSKDNDGRLLSLRKENANPEEKGKAPGDFVNDRPNTGLSTRTSTRKELLGAKNTWKRQLIPREPFQKNISPREMIVNDAKQQFISQKYSQPNLSAPQETLSKDSTKDSTSPIIDTKGSTEDVDAVAASEPSALGEQSTNDKTNETDEEAQFQQKTMSVMRGGEMVQVSYKVYIPKKIPALARRQLKR